MSYDVWLEIDTGGPETVEIWSRNYTSNVSRMWYHAMESGGHPEMAIWETGGLTGRTAADYLEDALAHMAANPEVYRPMNPDNGWGSYEGAMDFLRETIEQCRLHPRAVIRWSI